MRRTHALAQVLSAFLDDPAGRHWGYELSKRAGVRSGVMYPILHRMLDEGWLQDGWEDHGAGGKRPPRRYYTLTLAGQGIAAGLMSEMRVDARFAALLQGMAT